MVRVKNEGQFLPEWIAYYAELGVEHFYIYDNDSTDDTPIILSPFIEKGLVTYTHWPTSPIYPAADLDFFEHHAADSRWVAFFDPDEFVVENKRGDLLSVLRRSGKLAGVGINWRYFGSSYHETLPDGLILENFLKADSELDAHVKVVVQPRLVRRLRNPHNMYYSRAALARTAEGRRIYSSFARPLPVEAVALRLNHYVYRSRADYSRKATQGFADKKHGQEVPRHLSRIVSEFTKHNEVSTRPPAEAIERTRRRLAASGVPSLGENRD